jgi:hypothetical protein
VKSRLASVISRRRLLKALAFGFAGSTIVGSYAIAEPWRLTVARYRLTPPGWPGRLRLRLALIADVHACEPWMGLDRVAAIVARTNALAPDAVLLLGDYVTRHRFVRRPVPIAETARQLARLAAPLGRYAILGNHDWWDDDVVQRRGYGPPEAHLAIVRAGIPVLENRAVRLAKDGHGLWLAGLGDQWAFYHGDRSIRRIDGRSYQGVDDLAGTLAQITDDAPVVLMAHEPDIFATMPARVSLTVAGHTHGGQVTLAGFAPIVPSRFGRRYVYGHIVEDGRHMIVSAGLGCSGVPLRLGRPPEIVLIDLGGE